MIQQYLEYLEEFVFHPCPYVQLQFGIHQRFKVLFKGFLVNCRLIERTFGGLIEKSYLFIKETAEEI